MIQETTHFIHLQPSPGKLLTDGVTTSTDVYLPLDADTSAWTEIDKPEETPEELALKREEKARQSDAYAESLKTISFKGTTIWATPAERDNYLSTLQGAKRLGITSVPFFGITLQTEQAITIIDTINVWAMQVTATKDAHHKAILTLTTEEAINSYDCTAGYPEQLRFD